MFWHKAHRILSEDDVANFSAVGYVYLRASRQTRNSRVQERRVGLGPVAECGWERVCAQSFEEEMPFAHLS